MRSLLKVKMNDQKKNEYRSKGYWGDATLADCWHTAVLSYPEKIAVRDNWGTCYTFREIDNLSGRLAAYMRKSGILPGDIVSVQLPAWSEFFIIGVACFKTGAIINPILPNYRDRELTYILNQCHTKILFIPHQFKKCNYVSMLCKMMRSFHDLKRVIIVDKAAKRSYKKEKMVYLNWIFLNYKNDTPCSRVKADDVAAILFTSGSEGNPKGVMLTHNNIIASERSYTAAFDITSFDTLLMPAPIAHATGFHHAFIVSMLTGAACILVDIFNAAVCLELVDKYKCTCIIGATPFVHDVLHELKQKAYNLSMLRFFLCGGSPIHSETIKQALAMGLRVISVYGSTESVPHVSAFFHEPMDKFIQTDGKAMPGGIEIKVVDSFRREVPYGEQGEEASRGPNVFSGYLDEPELTEKVLDDEGWYYSGDLCVMDHNGYIKITGRKKDVIIRGGENISSSEVENILMVHPKIKEACVVPMPDKRLGEKVCAYVVLVHPNEPVTLEQIHCFFDQMHVAKYKYPERIEPVDFLPRTATCKINKRILREDIKRKLASSATD